MSWFGKQLGKVWDHLLPDDDEPPRRRRNETPGLSGVAQRSGRREPEATGRRNRKARENGTSEHWGAVERKVTAEVRAIVPKTMVESLCESRVASVSLDAEAVRQAAANRIFAEALYDILKIDAEPPFEPAGRILTWAEAALDEIGTAWRGDSEGENDAARGETSPVIQAVAAALQRAAENAVLKEAALRRLEEERTADDEA